MGAVFALVRTEIEFVCVSSAFFTAVPRTEESRYGENTVVCFSVAFCLSCLEKHPNLYKKSISSWFGRRFAGP